ncbi:MAG TPA: hypothetical protein VFN76_11625 [Candidatus Limnocylindria bacterium]|nr:hypothetical protein [Candidatus Limnocylindria bacterium]
MTDVIPVLFAATFLIMAILISGRRRGEPAWVIIGNVAGGTILMIGLIWAASIGADALWASMLAVVGIALWGQIEFSWFRRRKGR